MGVVDTHETKLRVTMHSGRVLHLHIALKDRVEWTSPFLCEVTDYGSPRPCTCCHWVKGGQRLQIKPADASIIEEVSGCWLSDDELREVERVQSLEWAEMVRHREA